MLREVALPTDLLKQKVVRIHPTPFLAVEFGLVRLGCVMLCYVMLCCVRLCYVELGLVFLKRLSVARDNVGFESHALQIF